MLMCNHPNNLKFRKFHKLKLKFNAHEQSLFCPKFYDYGLQATKCGYLTSKQIESSRRVISKFSKKKAYLKINVFPFTSLTKKPVSARMGKGKGKVSIWVHPVRAGRVLFEMYPFHKSLTESFIQTICVKSAKKLPFKSNFVKLVY